MRIALAVLLTVVLAPAAQAATITKVGDVIRYESSPGESDHVDIGVDGANIRFDIFMSPSDPPTSAGAPCTLSAPDATCPFDGNDRIEVVLGDASDFAGTKFNAAPTIPMRIEGGAGDDVLQGGDGQDILLGGDGSDSLSPWGNLQGDLQPDDVSGGEGFDTAFYAGTAGVRVSLDDVGNDGRNDGAEGDNVRSDVEDLNTGDGDDKLFGDGDGNIFEPGKGNDEVVGGGGVDVFVLGEGNDIARARDGLGERVTCGVGNDQVVGDDIDEVVDCETQDLSGELVRDIDKDGFSKPADCNDADPAINPSAVDHPDNGRDENCDGNDATVPDRDGDGVPRQFDCNDSNRAIHPGAQEIYGNKVDEDCNGRNDPLLTLRTPILSRFLASGSTTRVSRLQALSLERGTQVVVLCRGRGCPFKKRTIKVKKDTKKLDLRKRLKLKRLRKGARLEVRVLREDSIGRVARFRVRRGSIPAVSFLCMRPSDRSPRKC